MENTQQTIILIPGAFMDSNSTSNCPICLLGRFHAKSKRHIVRGSYISFKMIHIENEISLLPDKRHH